MKKTVFGFLMLFVFMLVFNINNASAEELNAESAKVVDVRYEYQYSTFEEKVGEQRYFAYSNISKSETLISSKIVATYPKYFLKENVYKVTTMTTPYYKVSEFFNLIKEERTYKVTTYSDGLVKYELVNVSKTPVSKRVQSYMYQEKTKVTYYYKTVLEKVSRVVTKK